MTAAPTLQRPPAVPATKPTARRVWPGRSYPLGAQFDGYGTNFAVYSGVAERVELCLFDPEETRDRKSTRLNPVTS